MIIRPGKNRPLPERWAAIYTIKVTDWVDCLPFLIYRKVNCATFTRVFVSKLRNRQLTKHPHKRLQAARHLATARLAIVRLAIIHLVTARSVIVRLAIIHLVTARSVIPHSITVRLAITHSPITQAAHNRLPLRKQNLLVAMMPLPSRHLKHGSHTCGNCHNKRFAGSIWVFTRI